MNTRRRAFPGQGGQAPLLLLALFLLPPLAQAQPGSASRKKSGPEPPPLDLPGKHRGAVNALAVDGEGRILSAGADGFLGIWNPGENALEERFQLSPYSLTALALRPGAEQAAFAETDGLGLYRVSVWDYPGKRNLFTLPLRDPVSYLSYSASGNFLIIARSGRNGVLFLHPETGEALPAPEALDSSVSFAATGKSERTMIVYSPLGSLSYWELDSGAEIRRFPVPPGLTPPVLFGNNRFFAGFGTGGLVILDATSGKTLIQDGRIPSGLLLPGSAEAEFICLSRRQRTLYRAGISADGRLVIREQKRLPEDLPEVAALAARAAADAALGAAVLGTAAGSVLTWAPGADSPQALRHGAPLRISEAAVSGSSLAFLTEGNRFGVIPLDFALLRDGERIPLEDAGGYTRVSGGTDAGGDEGDYRFMLWQTQSARPAPELRGSQGPSRLLTAPRFPLRSVLLRESECLLLDLVGNLSLVSLESGNTDFAFSAAGLLDAAFRDERHVVIGRSAAPENAPFLLINTETGETVPLPYPAAIGARVYQGPDGNLYGAVISGGAGSARTGVIKLGLGPREPPVLLAEYGGEDSGAGMAESGGTLAAVLGGEGAALCQPQGAVPFERTPGLPARITGAASWFIVVDSEGGVAWHDNQSGALAARLRLSSEEWALEIPEGESLRGRVAASLGLEQ